MPASKGQNTREKLMGRAFRRGFHILILKKEFHGVIYV